MKLLVRIIAAAAGIGAAVGAVLWAKKNLTVDVSKEPVTPEEKAELDEIEAEAAQKTEEELKDAEGNALKTALARSRRPRSPLRKNRLRKAPRSPLTPRLPPRPPRRPLLPPRRPLLPPPRRPPKNLPRWKRTAS